MLPKGFWKFNVQQLKAECTTRGLDISGITTRDALRKVVLEHEEVSEESGEQTVDVDWEKRKQIRAWEEDDRARVEKEKDKQREYEDRKREYEDKQREYALEKQREYEEKELEKRREHEYKLKELELGSPNYRAPEKVTPMRNIVKIPPLTETDDIEVYLGMFERIARTNEWEEKTWVTHLMQVLTGKAREAFMRMSPDATGQFSEVKKAILSRYDLSPEAYRKKFRGSKKDGNETFKEWGIRCRKYFEHWVGSSLKTAEELVELMIIEHLLNYTTPELQLWLRDRNPKSVEELTLLADSYRISRQGLRDNKPKVQWKPPSDQAGGSSSFEKGTGNPPSKPNGSRFVKCFKCGLQGHYKAECPKNTPVVNLCGSPSRKDNSLSKYIVQGKIMGQEVSMLVDTGSTCTLVSRGVVPDSALLNKSMSIRAVDNRLTRVPLAKLCIEGPAGKIDQEVGVIDNPMADVILGHDSFVILEGGENSLAVTRAQAKTFQSVQKNIAEKIERQAPNVTPLGNGSETVELGDDNMIPDIPLDDVPIGSKGRESGSHTANVSKLNTVVDDGILECGLKINSGVFKKLQQEDPTLEAIRKSVFNYPPQSKTGCYVVDGVIHRRFFPSQQGVASVDQIVVPQKCRPGLLELAHSIPLAGHLGVDKTRERLLCHYFWPGIYADVSQYCASCPQCQKAATGKHRLGKAPLKPIPVMGLPFRKIGMDIVGPLPRSKKGNRYILTVVDYATRYPEAFPLKTQSAEGIATAMIGMFARVGIPEEIVSDQGTSFMSELMTQLCQSLSVSQIRSSIYHPEANGLTERFNGTLKSMLRKFVHDDPETWDSYLPYILFAYREVPEASTGFSPFELVYGWEVKGPLSVVKSQWVDDPEDQSVVQHVLEMRHKLKTCLDVAHEHLKVSQETMKSWYDKAARVREFQVGDEVLVLLPSSARSLEAQWQGPYPVVRKLSDLDYEINVGKKRKTFKVFHVNLLKPWKNRKEIAMCTWVECAGPELAPIVKKPTESWRCADISDSLTESQRIGLESLLCEFSSVFTDRSSVTHVAEHHIDTGCADPIRQHNYRIPQVYQKAFRTEVEDMIEQGIIEESSSPWVSPVVIVPKVNPEGKHTGIRLCIDFKKINSVTKFDAFPLPRMEDLIEQLTSATFLSKLDLTKGYWQIPLTEETKEKTAFQTPFGLFQFTVMPFGMKTAPGSFQKMIQKVLKGTESFASAYIDDIVIRSQTWRDHLNHVREVLCRLQQANLKAKPSKCHFGQAGIVYLGHDVGCGTIRPLSAKIEAISVYPKPDNKKQIRAFLGLCGYYRKFCPNFSELSAPLSDLTSKKLPNKVKWTPETEQAFFSLKQALSTAPVLHLPDYQRLFIVQVDACERGLGAILCQRDEAGNECPVVFASKKLLDRERHLATVEKECLAMVWAVEHFRPYLYGRPFVVQTDHNSLVWINQVKDKNRKLLNWSLILQQYDITVQHKSGSANSNADALSRAH